VMKGQTKCGIEKSQAKPLIVEWPSPDRLELENTVRQGLAVVRYVGCEMSLQSRCRVAAKYAYHGATRTQDRVAMKDEDELYANLPAGAAKLEGKLQRAGQLTVDMNLVGRFESEKLTVKGYELQGDCDGATHFVYGVTVGAFEFYAGGQAEISASVGIAHVGATAESRAARETLTKAGDESACSKATTSDVAPPEGCGALIRLEVVPILRPSSPAPEAKPLAGPSGEFSQANMVAVGGGTFRMGARKDTVTVHPFLLDATEVTADAYAACVNGGGCSADGARCDESATYGVFGAGNHPVNCVDWSQANAYCHWTRKRLPTEEEWEWAARGQTAATIYPWGNVEASSQLCWKQSATCEVGRYLTGDAPGGIHDLAGNVWEWTSTDEDGKTRVVRGGSWHSTDSAHPRAAFRSFHPPSSRFGYLGFRCAR
jgi:formylglycine-generating enzyme required for sulfatase activity